MQELKRVLLGRTFLLALIAVLIVNAVLFYNGQADNDYGLDLSISNEIVWSVDGQITIGNDVDAAECYEKYSAYIEQYKNTDAVQVQVELKEKLSGLTGADKVAATAVLTQLEHINGYSDYLANIEKSKDSLLGSSIFNSADSFSGRNIIKTAKDFKALENVKLRLDTDTGITAFFNTRLTDYLSVILLAIVCITFLAERKKGLWSLIYATPNGRIKLHGKRVGILFLSSLLVTILLYGSNLFICNMVYGGLGDLSRPIQSVVIFGKFTSVLSVGETLLHYLFFRIMTLFVVAMLMGLLLAAIENVKVSLIATAAFIGVEYVLFSFLPVQSGFNIFKYFNVFTYISLSELYGNYLNIDLFGYPFSIRAMSFQAILPIFAILIGCYLLVGYRKKPMATHDYFGKYLYAVNRWTDKVFVKTHLLGMESYKVLFLQKGLLALIILAFVIPNLDFVASVLPQSQAEAQAEKIILSLEGELSDDTYTALDELQSQVNTVFNEYENAALQYASGEMEYEEYYNYELAFTTAKVQNDALQLVHGRIDELERIKEETGVTPWILCETPYERVYGENTQNNQQKAALVAILCLSLLLAGVFAYEKQNGTDMLLTACVNGRKRLLHRKYGICFMATVIVWVAIYGAEIYQLLIVCNASTFTAPIQSLSMFEKFPLRCSIAAFLGLLYIFRLLMLYCVSCVILFVSAMQNRISNAQITAVGITAIPSAVYFFLGVTPLKYVSATIPVSATSLILSTQGALLRIVIAGAVMTVIALTCVFAATKRQYNTDR